jgi:hypothetical protein
VVEDRVEISMRVCDARKVLEAIELFLTALPPLPEEPREDGSHDGDGDGLHVEVLRSRLRRRPRARALPRT